MTPAIFEHDKAVACFPGDYADAMVRWRALLGGLVCAHASDAVDADGSGPQGQPLATQTAWLGDADAARVMVLISATHGVEGYAGSAVQIDLLQRLQRVELPEAVAVLCVHALNPWGYAWDRRCDSDGIDINRNFVDFARPLPDNPGYRELQSAIHADALSCVQALEAYRRHYGREAFEIALSGGQYTDPDGPFFGGHAPSHARRVIERLITDHGLARRRLAVIDVHTGLGPYGYGEVICDHAPDSPGAQCARSWYGPACTLPELGTSSSVVKQGLLDYAWHQIMDARSCFVTLEFGTYGTQALFDVLLRDHRDWRAGVGVNRHAGAMREHFCPNDAHWREMVVLRARQVIDQAIAGLLAE